MYLLETKFGSREIAIHGLLQILGEGTHLLLGEF